MEDAGSALGVRELSGESFVFGTPKYHIYADCDVLQMPVFK